MLFLLIARILGADDSQTCRPCKGSDFVSIEACHKTGYTKPSADGTFESCVPEGNGPTLTGVKLILFFGIMSAVFIIITKLRRNYLLKGNKLSY